MLNIFYIEKNNRQKSYNLDSYGHNKQGNINKISQHHYQNKSWTERKCRAVWRFAEFSNVCDHLLQQRLLRISNA
jgi:hypothetical protein